MSELIVFIFEDEDSAKQLEGKLISAQANQELTVSDAALVKRRQDGRASLSHTANLVGRGSMGGIFWGFILALIFWTEWWGLSVGGALGDLGLDEEFVKDVGGNVDRGHSAFLAIIDSEMVPAALKVSEDLHPRVMRTEFSKEDEVLLKEVFLESREGNLS
jgi:uncharacterized membrane protein